MSNQPVILGSTKPPLRRWHRWGRINGWPDDPPPGLRRGDATYGYDHAALMQPPPPPPEPEDFVGFWSDLAARTHALPPSLVLDDAAPAPGALGATHTLQRGRFVSLDDFVVGCWVLLPRHGEPRQNLTFAHGYGGRYLPDLDEALVGADDAVILPCLRGLGELSLRPDIPVPAVEHVLHGIEDRDDYVLAGCTADLWRASAELDRLTGAGRHSFYGPSFGGGIGTFALMHRSYARAALYVPTFGNHPLRLTLPSVGSGAGLRRRARTDPGIRDVLAYFDAATAARHVTTPTIVAAALWDPAVPPPGQFAVYHGLAGEKQLVVQDAGHTEFPGDAAQHDARNRHLRDWLHRDVSAMP